MDEKVSGDQARITALEQRIEELEQSFANRIGICLQLLKSIERRIEAIEQHVNIVQSSYRH
jgi:tetrahydromethanopterin S-methyltransferase subunit G